MTIEIERLSEPFWKFSHDWVASNIHIIKQGIDHPFAVLTDRARSLSSVFAERLSWLKKTEKALRSFKEDTDKIKGVEGLFISMREAHNRTPSGYITDIRVTIPDSNRELEYRIYGAFRELLKTSHPLLFDLHLVKLRGRELEEVLPKGFWRYK